jgi:hypothetical protein
MSFKMCQSTLNSYAIAVVVYTVVTTSDSHCA